MTRRSRKRMHGPMPEDLIQKHFWIVDRFVAAYSAPGLGRLADLRAAGVLGLVEAARRYNRRRRTAFSTYAWNWVKGCILSELRRGHVVPVPEHMARRACKEGTPIRGVVRFLHGDIPVAGEQEPTSARAMQRRAVRQALDALHDPWQRAVIERTLAGQPIRQIAKGLKLTHRRVEELITEAQTILAGEVEWKT